ncbi:MAG: DNA-directed RNA polymerase subunit beta' [Thermotogae bacterium]|nr:DNA-directed RNA polymerase subunit beta' [Thermotogota bacterium]
MTKVSSFQRKIAKIQVGLASPDRIMEWSNGEVKKPETLNHRTSKPEKEGLFCEKTFGPTKDYECACGKYKGKKYEGTVCERCGVRVESKESRRRRMGHISLATPVSHIWYLKSSPSILSIILGIAVKDLENVIYYGSKRVIERAYLTIASEDNEKELDYYPGEILYQREFDIYSQYMEMNAEPAVRVAKTKGLPVSEIAGKVKIETEMTHTERDLSWVVITADDGTVKKYPVFEGASIMVEDGQYIEEGTTLADRFLFEEDYLTHDEYTVFSEYYPGRIEIERDIERDTPIVVITDIDKRYSKRIGKKIGDILLEDEARAYNDVMRILNSKIKAERVDTLGKILADDIIVGEKLYKKGITIIQDTLDELVDAQIKDLYLYDENKSIKTYQINKYEKFEASYGAEAIKKLLSQIDLEVLKAKLEAELEKLDKRSQKALKLLKRLKLSKDFIKSGNKPEWMIVEVLPVVPPDLRPLIQIDGGRFAATDLNDLYRKVINRNNRLRKLMDMDAPEIIVRNEKRILQQAVDSLIYNGRVGKPMTDRSKRPLRSLTDLLKGKKGRFRRNLLGKRVDYSGRAVITVGPDLQIHECGLPKKMALELFKPFVLAELLKDSNVASKNARKLKKTIIEKEMPQAWEILEEVIKGHPVMLNRAPTLHRLSIQAFIPKLIEGNVIRLHPLVCPPFNADFDGDQMAVHVPLSAVAQAEAKFLMLSRYNIISPANGKPVSMPGKDIIAGTYYLTTHDNFLFRDTKIPERVDQIGKDNYSEYVFSNSTEAEYVHEYSKVTNQFIYKEEDTDEIKWKKAKLTLHNPIVFRDEYGKKIKTTVGKIIFNNFVPEDLRDYETKMSKKGLKNLIFKTFKNYGIDRTAELLDHIKSYGYHYSTLSGLTISIRDVLVSPDREKLIEESEAKVLKTEELYEEGYLSDNERYKEIVYIWEEATKKVTDATALAYDNHTFNPIWQMVDSGARGTIDQLKQLAGMRGLMADPSGKIIEVPIKSNFKMGLSELEFFTSTHGSRKGSADTALRTSTAGYLTRRLVDVAQSIVITESDCGTVKGIEAQELWSDGSKIEDLSDFLFGRVLSKNVLDPETDKIIINSETGKKYIRNTMLDEIDGEFLSNYSREIHVSEEKELDLKTVNENTYYESLEHYGTDNDVILEKGEQLTKETAEELLRHGFKTIKAKEYKAVNFVFSGSELRVKDENDKDLTIVKYQEKIDIKTAKVLEKYGVKTVQVRPSIYIRSVLTCESENGICAKCYGMDMSNHKIVSIGESVGVIAAQSIGEPGTQLTMRTFHTGGIASAGGDITQGLPRAEELFEARKKTKGPDGSFSKVKGTVTGIERDENEGKKGKKLRFIVEDVNGEVETYEADFRTKVVVSIGDRVLPGERLTSGNIKPRSILDELGIDAVSTYLLKEIKKIYAEQGVDIHDKHFEIIIRQMLNKVEITDGGDTDYMPGDLMQYNKADSINRKILDENAKISENREEIINKKLAKRVIIPVENEDEEDKIYNIGEEVTKELLEEMIKIKIKEVEVYENYEETENEEGQLEIVGSKKTYLINPKNTIKYSRKLLRITKASLEKEGWLSAASFQQTVQILTEASIEGKDDYLKGLKENVIVGQPIPAGTGLKIYSELGFESTVQDREIIEERIQEKKII